MKCPHCDGVMAREARRHSTKIGTLTVIDTSGTVIVCQTCGVASLSQSELAGYERRAARHVLTVATHASGEVLKFARKALGLRQKDLALLLDTSEQQVSRWEHEQSLDRRLRLAMAALIDIAERNEIGLSELGTQRSRELEIVPRAS